MRLPVCAQPPRRYAATCAWVRMLIRITSVDVDFCGAVSCWVNLWVAFHFCKVAVFVSFLTCSSYRVQWLIVYIHRILGGIQFSPTLPDRLHKVRINAEESQQPSPTCRRHWKYSRCGRVKQKAKVRIQQLKAPLLDAA